jgi:hypothetical protein
VPFPIQLNRTATLTLIGFGANIVPHLAKHLENATVTELQGQLIPLDHYQTHLICATQPGNLLSKAEWIKSWERTLRGALMNWFNQKKDSPPEPPCFCLNNPEDLRRHLQWSRRDNLIKAEKNRDGLYWLGTNASKEQIPKEGVLSHYKNLLEVEDAFCHLKSYLQVRPVFHWRADRVRNHVRICFVAYWLTAKLERRWRQQDQTIEVHNLLRQLQTIRLGWLKVASKTLKTKITDVPKDLNPTLSKLGLLPLFSQPPAWAPRLV